MENISHSRSFSIIPTERPSDGRESIFHMVVAPDPSPDHSRLLGHPIRSWIQDNGLPTRNNGLNEQPEDRGKTIFIFLKYTGAFRKVFDITD